MPGEARAYWATGPAEGQIRAETLPARGHDDVIVRMCWSGVSRGTESLVAAGDVPQSQWQRMRCPFQAGDFPFPVKYGYAAVGIVEHGPFDLLGRHVFALYPHQTRFVVPAAMATAIPDKVPPERAVLAPNLETALNALWDSGVTPGERVVVIGAGVLGCLAAWLARQVIGTDVTLVDIRPERKAIARSLGVAFAVPETVGGEADVVIEASGNGAALASAFALAGEEATVLGLGWYGRSQPALPLGEDFHSKRLRLVSSQVGMVSPRQRPRWSHARRLAKVMELLADPALDVLISGESRFDDLPAVMPGIVGPAGNTLCHRIVYGDTN